MALTETAAQAAARAAFRVNGCAFYLGPVTWLLVPFFNCERADPNEFMVVMVIAPIASFTVPIAVMLMMPVVIIPGVIAMVLIGHGCERRANDGGADGES